MPDFTDPIDFDALKKDNILPSPNGLRLNIMRMCRQEDVSLPELVTQIQADPALAGRIVKIGNGALINKGRPIVAISKDLLLMIGLHAVRQLALVISLTTERRDNACVGFSYDKFWARTLVVSDWRRRAPKHMQPCWRKIPMRNNCCMRKKRASVTTISGLAAEMMRDWEIPPLFYEAVLHHETPDQFGLEEESRQLKLAQMLHVAGAIADYCIAAEADRLSALQALLSAGLPLAGEIIHVIAICDRVGHDWMEWGSLVKINTHSLPPTRDLMTQLQAQLAQ